MFRIAILVLSLCCSLLYASVSQAELLVTQATVRLLPPGVPNTSAYFTIENTSQQAVYLTGAEANFVDKAEIHNHVHDNGMMKMQQQAEVKIEAGKIVKFAPGGLHLMLFGLKQTLSENQLLELSIHTKSGQKISFQAHVKPPMAHKHHH
ncbi:copper chaperone PCu(A)C [Paraglaciecola aquimarina]|uniref:Copper chaperone PCu(A)C n=1 Tax=Paraglaciecola algarum TaxID=3050085 RepID=A0ABS9D332_9ALTE|nr:copper chaperone PCu(A)C [Paraglaciecola sp. G1-23]MCF2947324.1 copper chaperone PCu(A)C [Paraglaciecola sp. G1-23]